MATVLRVRASYDPEAGVWWAESDDVPGLVTEATTFEALMERAAEIAPLLLEANRPGLDDVTLEFHATRVLEAA